MRTLFGVFVLIGFVSSVVLGCNDPGFVASPRPSAEPESQISEVLIKEMWYSPEWAHIVSLRTEALEYISEALKRGVTKEELKAAVAHGMKESSTASVDALVFAGSDETAKDFRKAIVEANEAFLQKYPVLLTLDLASEEGTCALTPARIDGVIDNVDAILADQKASALYKSSGRTPPCGSWWQVAKLLACAATAGVVCAPGGPGGLLFCGWGCWCMLCNENSDLADLMC